MKCRGNNFDITHVQASERDDKGSNTRPGGRFTLLLIQYNEHPRSCSPRLFCTDITAHHIKREQERNATQEVRYPTYSYQPRY